MRVINCDHIEENKKLHPPYESISFANTCLYLCFTCHRAIIGDLLNGYTLINIKPILDEVNAMRDEVNELKSLAGEKDES